MKLKRLELQNFRCFAGLTIDFDPRLTILVGENGSGKTSILDALAVFLKSIAGFWGRRSLSLPQLKNTDMGFGESRQVNLRLTTLGPAAASPMLGGSFIKGKMGQDDLQIDEPDRREYEKVIESICKAYPDVHNKKTFPVLVYYSSKRTLPDDAALQSSRGESAVTAAFQNAFSPTIDFKNSLAWFADKDADEARMVRDENPEHKMPELEAVRQAVVAALGEYDSPRVRRSELIVFKKSAKDAYTLTRLGDGHRIMLALVMDLARRMAVANQDVVWGENETVLHSPTVVLIDEIELHLHPSWQQTVLPSLMGIFPNAQFIVATNSPQALTSIKQRHIRLLENGQAWPVGTSTYGAQSWRVLEDIFRVPSRPQDNEATRELDAYFALIDKGEGTSEKALSLRKNLEEWLSGDPALTEADMLIQRKERGKERQERRHA